MINIGKDPGVTNFRFKGRQAAALLWKAKLDELILHQIVYLKMFEIVGVKMRTT